MRILTRERDRQMLVGGFLLVLASAIIGVIALVNDSNPTSVVAVGIAFLGFLVIIGAISRRTKGE